MSASTASRRRNPDLEIAINGGVASVEEAAAHLRHVDGVMMGRAAYQEPWRLLAVDPLIFGEAAPFASPKEALEALIPYVSQELARGTRLHAMTRHVLGLFRGVPGARAFRRHLSTQAVKPLAGMDVLRESMALIVDTSAGFGAHESRLIHPRRNRSPRTCSAFPRASSPCSPRSLSRAAR